MADVRCLRYQSFVTIANSENISHPVSVPEFHNDPANDVIETGAQAAAGDDRGSRLRGIKIEPLPRASDLEGR